MTQMIMKIVADFLLIDYRVTVEDIIYNLYCFLHVANKSSIFGRFIQTESDV